MLIAIGVLTALGLGLGGLLGLAARVFAVEDGNPLVAEVEALLPGSQCGQCGFAGCTSAAEAVVNGDAKINFCPPGGSSLIETLAAKLDIDMSTLDAPAAPMVATIEKSLCTGCTRCFKACPTDAIVGASKQLHVVIRNACTGCGKCADICPENCISLQEELVTLENWHWPKPQAA